MKKAEPRRILVYDRRVPVNRVVGIEAYETRKRAPRYRSEAAGEAASMLRATQHGFSGWKQNGLGRASRPDRLLVGPHRFAVFVEYKREGEAPTRQQWEELKMLIGRGHHVAVCVDPQDTEEVLQLMTRSDRGGQTIWFYWEHRRETWKRPSKPARTR